MEKERGTTKGEVLEWKVSCRQKWNIWGLARMLSLGVEIYCDILPWSYSFVTLEHQPFRDVRPWQLKWWEIAEKTVILTQLLTFFDSRICYNAVKMLWKTNVVMKGESNAMLHIYGCTRSKLSIPEMMTLAKEKQRCGEYTVFTLTIGSAVCLELCRGVTI